MTTQVDRVKAEIDKARQQFDDSQADRPPLTPAQKAEVERAQAEAQAIADRALEPDEDTVQNEIDRITHSERTG